MPPKQQPPKKAMFPVAAIHRQLQEKTGDENVPANVAVYLSAVEEYLAVELIEKAAKVAKRESSNEVTPAEISKAIEEDSALREIFGKY